MNQSSQSTSYSLSFPDAIALTQSVIQQIETNQLNETERTKAIADIVQTKAGARGFFVAYLTGDSDLADHPTPEIIKGLELSPEVVGDLLVKNVAMSAAMKLTHLRNLDQNAAAESEQVNRRTINLIQQLNMPEIEREIKELQSTIMKGEGLYQEFLTRWGYDEEQQAAIQTAISSIKGKNNQQ